MDLIVPGVFTFHIGWFTLIVLIVLIGLLVRRATGLFKRRAEDAVDTALSIVAPGKEKSCGYVKAAEYVKKLKADAVVAVVDVKGIILNESRSAPALARSFATFGADLGEALRKLSTEPKLKAVLVRVNTPGGTITGSQAICDGLTRCREAGKYVIAYVPELSASGGVWSMVGAEYIVAHENAMLGSIGVLGPSLLQYEEVSEIGGGLFGGQVAAKKISSRRLFAGKGKAFGDPFVTIDEESVQRFQGILNRSYERFLMHLGRLRHRVSINRLRGIGASILDAPEALELGLIDAIGTFDIVKAAIAEKIGTAWDDCTVINLKLSGRERFGDIFAKMIMDTLPQARGRLLKSALADYPALALWEAGRF
jgi:protease-4